MDDERHGDEDLGTGIGRVEICWRFVGGRWGRLEGREGVSEEGLGGAYIRDS